MRVVARGQLEAVCQAHRQDCRLFRVLGLTFFRPLSFGQHNAVCQRHEAHRHDIRIYPVVGKATQQRAYRTLLGDRCRLGPVSYLQSVTIVKWYC